MISQDEFLKRHKLYEISSSVIKQLSSQTKDSDIAIIATVMVLLGFLEPGGCKNSIHYRFLYRFAHDYIETMRADES